MDSARPITLLLGGGYTLSRLAERLPAESFVITSRSQNSVDAFAHRGWNAALVDLSSGAAGVNETIRRYPSLTTIVDSVPPLDDRASGAASVCEAAEGTGVARVIYLSTTGVFGVNDGSWVDETTPIEPLNSRGRARAESEAVYRRASLRTTALRLPAIYGPTRGIGLSIKHGTYRLVEGGSRWTNRIHVEDLVEVLARLLSHKGELPATLCVSDDKPALARDVVDFYCRRFSLPRPPEISAAEAEERDMSFWTSSQRVRNTRLKSLLNFDLRYPDFIAGAGTEFSAA